MTRWIKYNPNPRTNTVGDCTIRALAKATGRYDNDADNWYYVYDCLYEIGRELCDMPSADRVWRTYMKRNGFDRRLVDDHGYDIYTVEDFCIDHPYGTYVLWIPGNNSGHVVCVVDGYAYDNWCSIQEVPEYYWTR